MRDCWGMPKVARDRHQALEERWEKGVWLGHARSTNAALIATGEGVTKAWGIRRLPEGQQWDGQTIKTTKGSPEDWKLDAGEDALLREMNDGGIPYEGSDMVTPRGSRTGERRSMYLRRNDFEKYGFSFRWVPWVPGCRRRLEDRNTILDIYF